MSANICDEVRDYLESFFRRGQRNALEICLSTVCGPRNPDGHWSDRESDVDKKLVSLRIHDFTDF